MESQQSFVRGALEAVGIVALFIGGGLGWAGVLDGGSPAAGSGAPALYPPAVEETRPAPRLWLVDGYNVLNVGLLAGRPREGWWSSQLREELLGRAETFDESDAEIWVVFDGPRPSDAPAEGRVRLVFAPSADDWLLARIPDRGATSRGHGLRPLPTLHLPTLHREGQEPGRVAVVTADRRLASRARRRGAEIVAPAEFLARCREIGA
jgi:hypothetical protein